jgi:hypothetical protein
MHRLIILPLLAALALVPAMAAGAGGKSHKVNTTLKGNTVDSHGKTVTDAAVATDPNIKSGNGAAVLHTTLSSDGKSATIKATVFYKDGSLSATSKITFDLSAPDTIPFAGTGKVTGGTGTYKGAAGSFKVTGTQSTAQTTSGRFSAKITGTITY